LSNSPLLEVDHIRKSFRGLVALKDLSFGIQKGEIVGLIGPNGAGKTTAFNIVAGVYRPDHGEVRFEGKKISSQKPHSVARLGIARTFQIVKPFPRMTVFENVLTAGLFGRSKTLLISSSKERAFDALQYSGLLSKSDALASQLSLAEQRRLELARALATDPKLLMLDEIMAGLNGREISQTLQILRKLNAERGIALLVIEHVVMAITSLCQRIVVMDHGEKLAEGTPSDIVNDARVIEAYMGSKRPPPENKEKENSSSPAPPSVPTN
jgi:branched-chain amino acid transport system ATP-binding protein